MSASRISSLVMRLVNRNTKEVTKSPRKRQTQTKLLQQLARSLDDGSPRGAETAAQVRLHPTQSPRDHTA